jgi:hypothetical protein
MEEEEERIIALQDSDGVGYKGWCFMVVDNRREV